MGMRKFAAAFLVLCLVFASFPALAAPTRDAQVVEVDVNAGMTDVLEIVVSALLGPQWPEDVKNGLVKEENSADEALAQKTLAYLMARQGMDTVSEEDAQKLLAQVYTTDWAGTLTDGACLEKTDKGDYSLVSASLENGYRLGVYPYSAEFDGVNVQVKADIFCCPAEYEGGADELPEATLTWLMNGSFELKFTPEKQFGYTVTSAALSPVFRDGNFSKWQDIENTEFEYSVNLPAELGQTGNDPAHMTWQNAAGDVNVAITVTEKKATYEEALAQFIQERPDEHVTQERLFEQFYLIGADTFDLMVVSDDLSWVYRLTMTFPAELRPEYSLYAEIIRNSLSVWGISNG